MYRTVCYIHTVCAHSSLALSARYLLPLSFAPIFCPSDEMYSRKGTPAVSLSAGSPSLQHNNLSSHGNTISYVRLNDVVVSNIKTSEAHRISLSTRSHIHTAVFVTVMDAIYLVVASSIGVQIWSQDGMVLKYFLPLNSVVTGESEIDAHYMDGVAAFSSGHICVGTSVGIVAVINSPTPDGERMSLQQPLPTKAGQAVTAVATGLATMVAGNELGDIFMFDYAGDVFEQVWVFPGVGYPCTSLGMHGDVIAAGYSSGHIRLYRSSVREMAIEITAHARIINAIKIHPTLNMFVSCGDDQFVNVWSLPDFQSVSSKDSELLYSERIPNRLLTGISFFDDDKIGLVSYDEDDLIMLTRSG